MERNEMITLHHTHDAAEAYILGFVHHHVLYAIELNELPDTVLKLDRASSSRGGQAKIRVRVSKAEKLALIAAGAQTVGVEADLTADDHHNRGDNFERIIAQRAGLSWSKNSTPFWVAGDLRIDGREIQVKLDSAELTNERALQTLLAELAGA